MLYLLFRIGSDSYALDARQIVEVLPLVSVKTIPGAPRGVAGLFDYRGASIPLIDLTELATGKPADHLVSTRILVVRHPHAAPEGRHLGLIVEKAHATLRRSEDDFVAADVTAAAFLGKVTRHGETIVQRIEVDSLLPAELRERLFQSAAG